MKPLIHYQPFIPAPHKDMREWGERGGVRERGGGRERGGERERGGGRGEGRGEKGERERGREFG